MFAYSKYEIWIEESVKAMVRICINNTLCISILSKLNNISPL